MEAILSFFGLAVIVVWAILDHYSPDTRLPKFGGFSARTERLNDERKDKQIAEVHRKIERLKSENPGKDYYRVGLRIREKEPFMVEAEQRVRELNAAYDDGEKRYYLEGWKIRDIGREGFLFLEMAEAARRHNNTAHIHGQWVEIDYAKRRIIDRYTKKEVVLPRLGEGWEYPADNL